LDNAFVPQKNSRPTILKKCCCAQAIRRNFEPFPDRTLTPRRANPDRRRRVKASAYAGMRNSPAHEGRARSYRSLTRCFEESDMGKYIFAWILGVPAVVLVGIYLVAHL
jgi:hypothetical protein